MKVDNHIPCFVWQVSNIDITFIFTDHQPSLRQRCLQDIDSLRKRMAQRMPTQYAKYADETLPMTGGRKKSIKLCSS